jgi:hypothetical protein
LTPLSPGTNPPSHPTALLLLAAPVLGQALAQAPAAVPTALALPTLTRPVIPCVVR